MSVYRLIAAGIGQGGRGEVCLHCSTGRDDSAGTMARRGEITSFPPLLSLPTSVVYNQVAKA